MERNIQTIKMRVVDLCGVNTHTDQYILILQEENGHRMLAIPVNEWDARDIGLAMRGLYGECMAVGNLLMTLLEASDCIVEDSVISDLEDGTYRSTVTMKFGGGEEVKKVIDTVEAVLLSMFKRVPLTIREDLLELQSTKMKRDGATIAIAANALNVEMLQEALQKAVDAENYELAAKLKEEINRRNA